MTVEAAELHDDVAASIDATLLREARRNELLMARVRVGMVAAFALVEVIYTAQGVGVPFVYRLPVLLYFFVALGIWRVLKGGGFHASLWVVVPVLDAVVILARLQTTFSFHPLEGLRAAMELATALGLSTVLVLSGAFRLRHKAVGTTTALGLAVYLWFGLQSALEWPQLITHSAILLGVGGIALALTSQVRRAVRSEVARVTLARFLPETVLAGAHADPIALLTSPREVKATVLVSDIRGFTAWSMSRDPIEVLAFLNVIQGAIAEVVRQHGGMVDKFMGDGMLAVFGAPTALDDHASKAVAAAKRMQEVVAQINARDGAGAIRLGIGVHTGKLVAGCLGSGMRMEFTILGDTVNTASRLEAYTKEADASVLLSQTTVDGLSVTDGLRRLGDVTLRGRDEALGIWTFETNEA